MCKWNHKYRLVIFLAALIILACTCPISLAGSGNKRDPNNTERWQETVDAIRQLTPDQPIPWHLIDPEAPVKEDLFDPNQLLVPLNHLSLRPGFTLDFVYRDNGLGANPVLYARKETEAPFESYQAFQAATSECDTADQPAECDYLAFVETDGSEAGYFQWVLLRVMGDQFYLYWHAGYHDAEIIASTTRLQNLVDELGQDDIGKPFSSSQKRAALKINPAPEVTIDDDLVTVRFNWFTKWGGFYETTYTITAQSPHQVMDTQIEQLVEYDCGVVY